MIWLPHRLEGRRAGKYLAILVEILSIFFMVVLTYYGIWLMISAHDRSPILELPRHLWYLCIPLAGVIMIAYSLRNLVGYCKGRSTLVQRQPKDIDPNSTPSQNWPAD